MHTVITVRDLNLPLCSSKCWCSRKERTCNTIADNSVSRNTETCNLMCYRSASSITNLIRCSKIIRNKVYCQCIRTRSSNLCDCCCCTSRRSSNIMSNSPSACGNTNCANRFRRLNIKCRCSTRLEYSTNVFKCKNISTCASANSLNCTLCIRCSLSDSCTNSERITSRV